MSTKIAFSGRLLSLAVEDGHELVHHPGSVAVLAIDGEGRVVLAPQRRPAVGEAALLEIPAGTRDAPGETAEATALRELEEETGLRAGRIEHAGAFFPSPGYTDERQDLYIATDLSGEARDCERVPIAEAAARVARGDVRDLKTAFAILLAARRLG